jgi:hypothetical protein
LLVGWVTTAAASDRYLVVRLSSAMVPVDAYRVLVGSLQQPLLAQGSESRSDAKSGERESISPKCTIVRYAGLTVGGEPRNLEIVQRADDPEDLIARNPLTCSPSAMTQTYVCTGAAMLRDRPAAVINWSETYLHVVTPVDLLGGRRDALVFIQRESALCLNDFPPSPDAVENLTRFVQSGRRYK